MIRLASLLALLAATFVAAATASTRAASCAGSQLAGSFSVVRGSAGAGNITYKLVLKNVSSRECVVTGLPQGRLLGKAGKPLPTHVKAAFPQGLTAILVHLAPGATTFATARFSPDVPGVGEPAAGTKCEPTSWWFRVTGQGGGTTKVKLAPPTPVCEHGRLLFSAYSVKG
jgi:Tfp pilus assembly protein FimT